VERYNQPPAELNDIGQATADMGRSCRVCRQAFLRFKSSSAYLFIARSANYMRTGFFTKRFLCV
jgi:hypothetical protein